jgi:hypothetical protein
MKCSAICICWAFFQIDNEEYEEALALAKAYSLDCDLVYQQQWRNNKVSVATIHDYLVSSILKSLVWENYMTPSIWEQVIRREGWNH